jgi:tRNA-specific 2-thiouridylase
LQLKNSEKTQDGTAPVLSDKKVLCAMSGGVDSSVVCALLHEDGYDVSGVMMKLYENEDIGEDIMKSCCSLAGQTDAEAVAQLLDVPFYVCNYTREFREQVMDHFASEYARGATPNPCLECNRFLKFGALFDRADKLRCRYIATGHYARLSFNEKSGLYELRRARDEHKDQTYALYFLGQKELSRLLFPLGDYLKSETRAMANKFHLPNAQKHDSQDICFVPSGDYRDFLRQYTDFEDKPGDFVAQDTREVLGEHTGYRNYTLGQRRGLGVSAASRLYVTGIDPEENVVALGDNADLLCGYCETEDCHIVAGSESFTPGEYQVCVRYNGKQVPADVTALGGRLQIRFRQPQRAVTLGQHAVLYQGDRVIGGGRIASAGRAQI